MSDSPRSESTDDSTPDPDVLVEEIALLKRENERLRQQDTMVLDRPPRQRRRWIGAVVLLLVAALLTPPALVGFWGRQTIVNANRYLETVAPLAQNSAIQQAVADEVAVQLLTRVDVDAYLKEYLPPEAQVLAPALSGAVQTFVETSIDKFLASDAFDQLWLDVNVKIQEELVRALNGDTTGAVQVQNGTVTLDLTVVIETVRQRLVERGLTVLEKVTIPASTGSQIVLLTSSQLAAAENIWTYTDPIARWLLPIVFLLYLGAILLAPNRRRMLLIAGLTVFVGMALLAIALSLVRTGVVDSASSGQYGAAITAFYDTMVRYLVGSMGAIAVLGLVMAFFAWAGGPSAPAAWLRDLEARATTALGEAAGRWHPLATFGHWCRGARPALRGVLLAVVIVGFLLYGEANWKTVLISVVLAGLSWLLIDVLAAAAVHADLGGSDEGPGEPPPTDSDAPEPVLA